jgi:hypothetical protein
MSVDAGGAREVSEKFSMVPPVPVVGWVLEAAMPTEVKLEAACGTVVVAPTNV